MCGRPLGEESFAGDTGGFEYLAVQLIVVSGRVADNLCIDGAQLPAGGQPVPALLEEGQRRHGFRGQRFDVSPVLGGMALHGAGQGVEPVALAGD